MQIFMVLFDFVRLDENRFLLFVFVYCLLVFGETECIYFYYGGILFLVGSFVEKNILRVSMCAPLQLSPGDVLDSNNNNNNK